MQVVASSASDSASRMAIFATINSASALVIAGLQLFATGFLLTRLKLPAALTASSAVAAGVMAVIAFHPSPVVVGGGEVIRKVGIAAHVTHLHFQCDRDGGVHVVALSEVRMLCKCSVFPCKKSAWRIVTVCSVFLTYACIPVKLPFPSSIEQVNLRAGRQLCPDKASS